MNETIAQQGSFTSTGSQKTIIIRSDLDWMRVRNYSVINAATPDYGIAYYWQRDMKNDAIVTKFNAAGTETVDTTVTALRIAGKNAYGFSLIDTSRPQTLVIHPIVASTNDVQPVITTAYTSGIATGSILRLSKIVGQSALCGIDFEIDNVVAGISFRIRYPMANAPGAVGLGGYYYNRGLIRDTAFLPQRYYIANITTGRTTLVQLTTSHFYGIGSKIRFHIPQVCGMTELNNLVGTIISKTAATFTVNIDSTGFTAFRFPTIATSFTPATVNEIGGSFDFNILNTTIDAGYIGIILGAGNWGPAGNAGNKIYWTAGKDSGSEIAMI